MPAPDHKALLNEAWTRLVTLREVTHENPSDLPCHPSATALVVRAGAIALQVCVKCLAAFLTTSDGATYSSLPADKTKRCQQCQQLAPVDDFLSRAGWETRFCSVCRSAWGKARRAEAAIEEEKAVVSATLDKHQAQVDLENLRAGLQRLEQELLE